MTKDFRHLTQRRTKVGAFRELLDGVTGLLYGVPIIGPIIDEVGDAATNLGMYLYSLASSPYLPGRDFSPGMLALETLGYTLTAGVEAIPGVNDVMPGYALAGKIFDAIYERRLRKKGEKAEEEGRIAVGTPRLRTSGARA